VNLSERLAKAEQGRPARAAGDADAPRRIAATPAQRASTARPTAARTTPTTRRKGSSRAGVSPIEGIADLRAQVRATVVERIGPTLAGGDVDEERLYKELEAALDEAARRSRVTVPPSERSAFLAMTLEEMLGWGALTPLMEDPTITEIMCNGAHEIWVERSGVIEATEVRFPNESAYRQVIDRMLATAGRRVDEASPYADGRLPDGSRVNAIVPPLSVRGACLTVRRFPETAFTVADLISRESLSADASVFLEAAVRGKLNLLVSGGTGTGKTTLLNVLSAFVPDAERLITVEDAAELRLGQPHVVTLEARPANIEGAGQVTIRDLVRNALRMRPDRIVVGEVRGGEALDMLQAMNTGHEGSLTTVHANSPRDALSRVETMVLMSGLDLPLRAVREQIASALDVIVQLDRLGDGRRVVSGIAEVQGREGETVTLQDIFVRRGGGPLVSAGLRPACLAKIEERGVTVPASILRGKTSATAGAGARSATLARRKR
jgi:pilus assembly protein CpaF